MIDYATMLRTIADGYHEVGEFGYADAKNLEKTADFVEKFLSPSEPVPCPGCKRPAVLVNHSSPVNKWHIGCADAFIRPHVDEEPCPVKPAHMGYDDRETAVSGWNEWAKSFGERS